VNLCCDWLERVAQSDHPTHRTPQGTQSEWLPDRGHCAQDSLQSVRGQQWGIRNRQRSQDAPSHSAFKYEVPPLYRQYQVRGEIEILPIDTSSLQSSDFLTKPVECVNVFHYEIKHESRIYLHNLNLSYLG
jgi:hypothetical protein